MSEDQITRTEYKYDEITTVKNNGDEILTCPKCQTKLITCPDKDGKKRSFLEEGERRSCSRCGINISRRENTLIFEEI